jgi:peptide deformylase
MIAKIVQIDYKKEEKEQMIDESSVLRFSAKDVTQKEFGTLDLKNILEDMKSAMDKEEDGVAIAAPQIGVSKKIFIVKERAYSEEAK